MGSEKPNSTLVFFVNGKKVTDSDVDPEWTLLYYLRKKLRLCGTKFGCGEGGCGACTVMVSHYNRKSNSIHHWSINSCLAPVCSMHGLAVTTVEGIGSTKTKLHPAQQRIALSHGSQCGFCTPGIVMSMYTALRNHPKLTMHDLDVALTGNLCRCTGYRPILEAYKTFTEEWETTQMTNGLTNGKANGCMMGEACCKNQKEEPDPLYDISNFTPYDLSQEPIFPPELKTSNKYDNQQIFFKGKRVNWYRPVTLQQLVKLKHEYPDAKIVVGNTEVGVEVKFKNMYYPVLIQTCHIPELTEITVTETGVLVGASATLEELRSVMKNLIQTKPQHSTRIFASVKDILYYFASLQIRNVASVGGNIMTSSPISDLNPIFQATGCDLHVVSTRGERIVKMDENFFTGYRKNVIDKDEVLVSINIPYTKENQYFYAYKQAKRRDDDIAFVTMALNVYIDNSCISDIKLSFGGMAPTTVMALKTQKALRTEKWSEDMLEKALYYLIDDLPLAPSAPGGYIQFRRSLTLSMFYRAYLAVAQQLQMDIPKKYLSGIDNLKFKQPKSSQYYEIVKNGETTDMVGKPIHAVAACKQATGETLYVDDMPFREGELYLAFVLSTRPHAEILSIDPSEALAIEGVHSFLSAKDMEGFNNTSGIFLDEEIFRSKTVTARGQTIAVVIAEDQRTAQRAAQKVKVEYKDLSPVIITIEDAIKHNSYLDEAHTIVFGDPDGVLAKAEYIVEGECRTGAQEHFYLETHGCLAIPKIEDDEIEIWSSTQNPTDVAKMAAEMLKLDNNRVVAKVKRLGGGFGGKESRAIVSALPVTFAAYKLKRPIRCVLDRNEDILMTGTRHPFLMKYKAAFDKEGKITACDVLLYNNGGYSKELTLAVMDRGVVHFQNAYTIPNVRVSGYCCKTNIASNTAFRGFGAPQTMMVGEYIVRDIADRLGKDYVDIIRLNLARDGDLTHYNQHLTDVTLDRCLQKCLHKADYNIRVKEVEKFNKENRWKKRGISVVPTMYGIAFTLQFLNQSGAFIIVYTDGSVLLTFGGVEMGQGLNTKMIQIASRVLGVPMDTIHVSECATDKVPNTSPTAASSGSDLNGPAVLDACQKIMDRLAPYKKKNPQGKFGDWVKAAYFDRVSLSATGFYKTPDLNYDMKTNTGRCFNYFTYGVAISEVEVDCLTGDHQVLRTDIVMDLGESLNPAIDIGQIEGAFMQGYGWCTLEELMYSPDGMIWTQGPGAYKIPGFGDIPVEFNVSLLKGAPNPRAVYSSKAVGEPPLFLASSVLFAIREAIKSARLDAGVKEYFRLDAPATAGVIRMGCVDNLTKKLKEPEPGSFKPWNVTA